MGDLLDRPMQAVLIGAALLVAMVVGQGHIRAAWRTLWWRRRRPSALAKTTDALPRVAMRPMPVTLRGTGREAPRTRAAAGEDDEHAEWPGAGGAA